MPTQIDLLKKYGLSIRGQMGQHLLIDPNMQRKIVDLLELKAEETVFEIGPGLGALTAEILKRGARVFAVEKDIRFVEILKQEFADPPGLEIVHEDILKFDFSAFRKKIGKKGKVKVVGNLPYYITAPILFCLSEQHTMIRKAVLMMQEEVADRVLASPGSKEYGRLTLAVRYAAEVRHGFNVPASCFTPQPEVSSSVLEFFFYGQKELLEPEKEKAVFKLVETAFSQRRKTFLGILSHQEKGLGREKLSKIFESVGIAPMARGEELMLKDYLALAEALDRCKGARPCAPTKI